MCQIKRRTVYMCPICKKTYKNKGYYLNKHLKQCNAIAWIPQVKVEILIKQIEEESFAQAIQAIITGNYQQTISVDKSSQGELWVRKKTRIKHTPKSLPGFMEYKQEYLTGNLKLKKVPKNELRHIYNIMVAKT